MYCRYSIAPSEDKVVVKEFEDLMRLFPQFPDWVRFHRLQRYVLLGANNLARGAVASPAFKLGFDLTGESHCPQLNFGEYFVYEVVHFIIADKGVDAQEFSEEINERGYWYLDVNFCPGRVVDLLNDDESKPPDGHLYQLVSDVCLVCGPREAFSVEALREMMEQEKASSGKKT